MRVLFATHEIGATGATIALLDRARHLIANNHTVAVCAPERVLKSPSPILQDLADAGVKLLVKFNTNDFDLLVANPIFSPSIILGANRQLTIIGWIHEALAGVWTAMNNLNILRAMLSVDRLIFPTRFAAKCFDSFLLGYPAERISIVPYAVRPAADVVPAAKSAGKTRIVFVGSVYPRKRPGDLVKAVLALDDPTVECQLIGESYDNDAEFEQLVNPHPQVFSRPGPVTPDTLQAIYRSADLFCLPSEDESFGIAPMEAAAHGVPVVLADLRCYEGLWRHGTNCLLYPVGDVHLLTVSLQALIGAADLRQRLGSEGAKLARIFTHKRFNALFDIATDDALAGAAGVRGGQ